MSGLRRVLAFMRRHRPEGWLSALIAVAALAPGLLGFEFSSAQLQRYDPNLAVLALTAIAVVWYTGLTHRALQGARLDRLEAELRSLQEMMEAIEEIRRTMSDFPRNKPSAAKMSGKKLASEKAAQRLFEMRFRVRGRWREEIVEAMDALNEIRGLVIRAFSGAPTAERDAFLAEKGADYASWFQTFDTRLTKVADEVTEELKARHKLIGSLYE